MFSNYCCYWYVSPSYYQPETLKQNIKAEVTKWRRQPVKIFARSVPVSLLVAAKTVCHRGRGHLGRKSPTPHEPVHSKVCLREQRSTKEAGVVCRARLQSSILRSCSRQLERTYPNPVGCEQTDIHNDLFWFQLRLKTRW